MTYPEDPHQNITDSAAAATAMSAGIKTYNAAIGVDNDGSSVKTVLKLRKKKANQLDWLRLLKLHMLHLLHMVHMMLTVKT